MAFFHDFIVYFPSYSFQASFSCWFVNLPKHFYVPPDAKRESDRLVLPVVFPDLCYFERAKLAVIGSGGREGSGR